MGKKMNRGVKNMNKLDFNDVMSDIRLFEMKEKRIMLEKNHLTKLGGYDNEIKCKNLEVSLEENALRLYESYNRLNNLFANEKRK